MEKDLAKKISDTLCKGELIEENDIRSVMLMIRKILDNSEKDNGNDYLIIRLFCNWCAHIKITDSNTGLRILAKINDSLVNIKNCGDMQKIRLEISKAIGFSALRNELNSFLISKEIDNSIISNNKLWSVYLDSLIEIIRDVPISFPPLTTLDKTKSKIYEQISQNPIKPGAGVISIKITLFNYPMEGEIMSLAVKTEDTTTLIIPLLIDVSL